MSNEINLLLTILYNDSLLKVAFKCKDLPQACIEYPMEPSSREIIHRLLPLHIQTCGKIVDIEQLFDIVEVSL